MVRNGRVRLATFGFGLGVFALLPSDTGYQDIAALLARQAGVAERYQAQFVAPLTTLHAAAFSFPRPLGTAIREPASYRLASLDLRGLDITGSLGVQPFGEALDRPPSPREFPEVNRSAKGDRLVPQPAAPTEEATEVAGPEPRAGAAPLDPELEAALAAAPLTQYGAAAVPPDDSRDGDEAEPQEAYEGFSLQSAGLFLGTSLGPRTDQLERWRPGEEPVIVPDPALKPPAADPAVPARGGESVAGKGKVAGEERHPQTPAERLGLAGPARAKAERCLADAVYYEARGEAVRGQIAVAQVVLNRAFSGFYPTTVCGVVYQNKHRWMACQFSFACDGSMRKGINEPDMWERARKIAREILDGRLWLPEVGKSTHYHASWVRPSWVGEMKRLYRFGVHTFYRPRAWGDGSEAPTWGTPETTAAVSAKL